MSDLIRLDHGQPPWKPTAATEMAVEYRYYDVPLVGVLRQDDREYLFQELAHGEDNPLSLWLYALITDSERAHLEADPALFNERLKDLHLSGWGRLALATDRLGIVDTEDTEVDRASLQAALGRLVDRLDHLRRQADLLRI